MPDILLVHGSCHGAWAFRDLAPALQDLGYTARAIDLPGHGNTPTPSPISHWSYTQIRFWTRLRKRDCSGPFHGGLSHFSGGGKGT